MTTEQHIFHAIEQGNDVVAVAFERICDICNFIIRINAIENSKREGSCEATEAFRRELKRYIHSDRL